VAPNPRLLGRSFLWAFILSLGLFGLSMLLSINGHPLGTAFAVAAGAVPFVVQAVTGYGFDRRWVARFSRTDYPIKYALLLFLSLAVMVWFGYISWLATTSSETSPPNTSLERAREG
jgi:hypothetical protein